MMMMSRADPRALWRQQCRLLSAWLTPTYVRILNGFVSKYCQRSDKASSCLYMKYLHWTVHVVSVQRLNSFFPAPPNRRIWQIRCLHGRICLTPLPTASCASCPAAPLPSALLWRCSQRRPPTVTPQILFFASCNWYRLLPSINPAFKSG